MKHKRKPTPITIEALAEGIYHQRELKRLRNRSSKDILVDGILDGSYARYLKGE